MVWLICVLVLVGALLLVVELVMLPGITIAAIASLGCYGGAAWMAYDNYGVGGLLWVVAAGIVLSVVATWFSLRAKTWQKFALRNSVEGISGEAPSKKIKKGDRGVALSRLAPMGTVTIGGVGYEAKTLGGFVDPGTEVEVTGFENLNVVVRRV